MQAAQFQAEKVLCTPSAWAWEPTTTSWTASARISSTDDNGQSPRSSGNPAEYEQQLTEIFKKIIKNPGCDW